jgi:hypothetical protein
MKDPQEEEISALIRMAMYLYNRGYNSGHHDTVEGKYGTVHHCDMENYHEEEVREIVQDFLGDDLTDQELEEIERILKYHEDHSISSGY